ncbi:hypothetical protein MRX96_054674 [Rhipicephalus microplus]
MRRRRGEAALRRVYRRRRVARWKRQQLVQASVMRGIPASPPLVNDFFSASSSSCSTHDASDLLSSHGRPDTTTSAGPFYFRR